MSGAGPVGCKRDQAAPEHDGVPTRVISQVVDADEILWKLGPEARQRVVGISGMADDPRYSAIAGVWPDSVPRIPATSESLLAASPDLVIVSEFSAAETRALLRASGVQLLELQGFDGFDDYRGRVRVLASALSLGPEGEALVRHFDAQLAEHRRAPSSDAPAVISWVEGNVAGSGTTFDDVTRAAGLRNLAAEHGLKGHRNVPLEQVVAWNPDVVVTLCEGTDCKGTANALAQRPGWSATTAARTGRVLALPGPVLFSAGESMLQAVRRLAALHEGP